jgi:HK97 family phage major capsid protein
MKRTEDPRAELAIIEASIKNLTEADELTDEIRDQIARKERRADELVAQIRRESRGPVAKPDTVSYTDKRSEERAFRVNGEQRTYNPDDPKEGRSFLRDLMNAGHDFAAQERLQRHSRQAESEIERRDIATSAVAGLTVPQYIVDLVAPMRRAGRPTLDICTVHPLPVDGMTVNISRVTTGSATAAQATENAAVQRRTSTTRS